MRCECGDTGCKCKANCGNPAFNILYRVDMDDKTGTFFCQDCGNDAMESGVFSDQPRGAGNCDECGYINCICVPDDEVGESIQIGFTANQTCLNCNKQTSGPIYQDNLGQHTVCEHCGASFNIDDTDDLICSECDTHVPRDVVIVSYVPESEKGWACRPCFEQIQVNVVLGRENEY